jgi:hypothetical protein
MQCHHVHPFTLSTKWTSFQKNVCITTTVPVLLAETYQRKNGYTLRPDTGCVRYVSSTIVRDADPSFQSAFFVVRYGWRTAYNSNSSSLRMPHPHIFSTQACEGGNFDSQALSRLPSIGAKSPVNSPTTTWRRGWLPESTGLFA